MQSNIITAIKATPLPALNTSLERAIHLLIMAPVYTQILSLWCDKFSISGGASFQVATSAIGIEVRVHDVYVLQIFSLLFLKSQ